MITAVTRSTRETLAVSRSMERNSKMNATMESSASGRRWLAILMFGGLTGAGLNQINIKVPELPPGTHLVTIEVGGTAIQGNVVLPVN